MLANNRPPLPQLFRRLCALALALCLLPAGALWAAEHRPLALGKDDAGQVVEAPLEPAVEPARELLLEAQSAIEPARELLLEAQPAAALLPDLQTLPPNELSVEQAAGNRRLLRLGNTVWNSGAGPLVLLGAHNPAMQATIVSQRISYSDGATRDHLAGAFVWHPEHAHFHFEDYTLYEVWRLTPELTLHSVAARSAKVSWCVMEVVAVDRDHPAFPRFRQFTTCDEAQQGLQPGWGDRYGAHLPGQEVDITGLPDGTYALMSTANPGRLLLEQSYSNNSATVLFELRGSRVRLLGPVALAPAHCQAGIPC